MITPLDVTGKLYKLLNVASVKGLINGALYNSQPRPVYVKGQSKSDITIWPLAQTGSSLQTGVINVNIVVPDKPNGTTDTVLINQITKAVISVLDNAYIDEIEAEAEIQRMTLLADTETGEHYMNIRVYFANPNI